MTSRHEMKVGDVGEEGRGYTGEGMAREKSEKFSTGMIEYSRSGGFVERRDRERSNKFSKSLFSSSNEMIFSRIVTRDAAFVASLSGHASSKVLIC